MARRSDNSLSPTALNAMSKSLSLASTVLGFDIVELWSDAGDGKGLHCTFAHASDEQLSKHPSIIYGYYPKHQKPHKLSPLVSPTIHPRPCCVLDVLLLVLAPAL